jgi:hypothetical protein
MIKKCIFCGKNYEVTRGCVLKKSKYCSPRCHDKYWLLKGNKSGKFMGNKLALGKEIRKTQSLSSIQKEMIFGTLLGDASIDLSRKGSKSLRFQHTEDQLEYLLFKEKILNNFIIREKPTFCKARMSKPINNIIVNSQASYTLATVVHQDFEEINSLFYKKINKKRIKIFKKELFNLVTPFSLLFWYIDDGSLSKNSIHLHTNNFSYKEHLMIQQFFKEKFGLTAKIQLIRNQDNFYLRFNKIDKEQLMKIFEQFKEQIPACVKYKFTFFN